MRTLAAVLVAASLAACASAGTHRSWSQEGSLEEAFARVHSSVVTIRTVERDAVENQAGFVSIAGVGSGVLVSAKGEILTASHVVHNADQIQVEFPNGKTIPARVLSSDRSADLALIQLAQAPPIEAGVVPLGDSDLVAVGSRVFVVGAPLGVAHTLTVGHISARRKSTGLRGFGESEFFQTDAAINQGNSGGPLFNMRGEVIGIVSYIISETGGSSGLGFAVTSNVCREQMLNRKHIWTGFDELVIEGDLAAAFNVPGGVRCLLIQRVAKGSPAERLGLRGGTIPITVHGQSVLIGGDIILGVQGIPMSDPKAMTKIVEAVEALPQGADITLTVLREGKTMQIAGSFAPQ